MSTCFSCQIRKLPHYIPYTPLKPWNAILQLIKSSELIHVSMQFFQKEHGRFISSHPSEFIHASVQFYQQEYGSSLLPPSGMLYDLPVWPIAQGFPCGLLSKHKRGPRLSYFQAQFNTVKKSTQDRYILQLNDCPLVEIVFLILGAYLSFSSFQSVRTMGTPII